MIAGKKYNGLLVDIWSCGIILYAMLCGYLPFEDPDTTELYKKILKGEFELPEFLSSNAKDILKKVMNTDPDTRYKIKDIRKHPWYSLAKAEKSDEGIMVGYQTIPIDPLIISELSSYGIDPEYARKCLEANRHNEVTTTYYLLIKKHQKEGRKDVIDPNSSLCLQKVSQESIRKAASAHEETKNAHGLDKINSCDSGTKPYVPNAIDSINLESSLGLYDIENRYSDYVTDSKPEYKTAYKPKPITESYRKQPGKLDLLFTKLKVSKNSKQYGMTSKLPQKAVNRSHHLEMTRDSRQSSLNESLPPDRNELSFGVFADSGNSNERLQKIYEVYKKVVTQAKAHQQLVSNVAKMSPVTKALRVPRPPLDSKVDSRVVPSRRQNKFVTNDFSPYVTKLNTSVRPVTKSQAKKRAVNISVRKATSHAEGRRRAGQRGEDETGPITIIQAPLINTYNNYNSFNIGNFSLGHIQESAATKPPVPNFRRRKYFGHSKA